MDDDGPAALAKPRPPPRAPQARRRSHAPGADPEVQKLTVIYGREAQGFDVHLAQSAPPTLRTRFFAITAKFREVLQLHMRMVTRVKNASEGLIRAIATEVDRANAPARTYSSRPGYKAPSSGAMVFNKVV